MALLSMRMSGTNLDAFRHALERQHPIDYLAFGYYGRWLKMAENLLIDSSIIAPGAVDARARKLRGEDVEEPPAPEPNKPDYKPTAAGSLRQVDDPPAVRGGRPGAGQATSTPPATPACPATCGAAPARCG